MMKFDGTITLGNLVSAAAFLVGILVAYTKAARWLTRFETTVNGHTDELTKHSGRMDRYESRYVEIASDLQWLIGRMNGDRRRTGGDRIK